MKHNRMSLIASIAAVLILLSGCGANTNAANSANSTDDSKQASGTAVKSAVLDLYNKVELGQTKDKIDALLAVAPAADTQVPNQYRYEDSDTGYGVAVLYDKTGKATGKTAMYGSHADIAPLCKKAVAKDQTAKITKGMTNDQIVKLLGGEGVEVGRYDFELNGQASLILRWANSNGSCIQVSFGADGKADDSLFYEE